MNLDDASRAVAIVPPSLNEHREMLAEAHAEHPQRAQLADLAMQEIEAGLAKLHSLGHHFVLVAGSPPPTDEFPKMLYSDDPSSGLAQYIAHDQQEEDELVEQGWRTTQQEQELQPQEQAEALSTNEPPSQGLDQGSSEPGIVTSASPNAGLPPEGAAGPGATSQGNDVVSEQEPAQQDQMQAAQAQVAPSNSPS